VINRQIVVLEPQAIDTTIYWSHKQQILETGATNDKADTGATSNRYWSHEGQEIDTTGVTNDRRYWRLAGATGGATRRQILVS